MEKINKRGRHRLTDDEFNALTKFTANVHLDQAGFDVYELEDEDVFVEEYGSDEEHYISLYDGLHVIFETCAYPFKHNSMTEKEAELICNLFVEFNITDDEKVLEWLKSDED